MTWILHGIIKRLNIKTTHHNKIIVCAREKSIISVKDPRNCESESKGDLYINIKKVKYEVLYQKRCSLLLS